MPALPVTVHGKPLLLLSRIRTMNLIGFGLFVSSRSMTALHYDAPARVARWKDWFRLATCVLIGELVLPAGEICSFGILAGHGEADKIIDNHYANSLLACD